MRSRISLCLLYLVFLWCTVCGDGCIGNPYIKSSGPLIETYSGYLVGKYVQAPNGAVVAFLGIPYALPPTGDLRFAKPCAVTKWEGILKATVKPPPCMQFSSRKFSWVPDSEASEDCLYLNVWTPSNCCCNGNQKLPVLVWIYGGGFYSGSSDMDVYDGATIASRGQVVVVSINYRVGVFGFLNSGTEEAPGNMGLLDQNLALKWIKWNIANFGGDPDKITVMGESAGAMSISLHMLSGMSKYLFRRAILQSGTAYNQQIVDSPEVSFFKASTYAQFVGCLNENYSIAYNAEAVKCLKSKNAVELAKVEDAFASKFPLFFIPSYGDEFLPEMPIKSINAGHLQPTEVLIGNVQDEGTIFLNYIIPDVFKLESEPLLNLEAAEQLITALFQRVPQPTGKEIFDYYFQNISNDPGVITKTIAQALGDYVLVCPTKFFAEKAKCSYVYWLSHRSSLDTNADWVGVPHFSDVPYVFGDPIRNVYNYSKEDKKFSEDVIDKWITFAKEGHPLGEKVPKAWPSFSADEPNTYELNSKRNGLINFPRADACEFWRPYLSQSSC